MKLSRLHVGSVVLALTVVVSWPGTAPAPPATVPPMIDVGSDGSDGFFNPQQDIVVDLSEAPNGTWDTPGTGKGVYDTENWAVVYKFSGIYIPAGVTVTFKNHPSRAPVVWLCQGDVTIAGSVNLDGEGWNSQNSYPEPGPGGFRGGRALGSPKSSGGFGPGGAYPDTRDGSHRGHTSSASHATPGQTIDVPIAPTYGYFALSNLIGGSGGAAYLHTLVAQEVGLF